MSKYDKASLIQIPSGYNVGTLYSVVPTNSNGDFDFSRESSATRVNKDGFIESVAANVPRLDYPLIDGVVQDCPALLLEPATTQSLQNSENFSSGSWSKGNLTSTSDQAISPDGSQTADKITPDSITGVIRISQIQTVSASDYTLSFFVKSNGRQFIQLLFSGVLNPTAYANFDLINGIVTGGDGNIENFGNDWYRISLSASLNSGGDRVYLWVIDTATASRGAVSTGNGTDGYYVWGSQLEQGSYLTSYIPTSGSSVTRSADVCGDSGTSAEINSEEGVLYIETSALANDLSERRFGISDGGSGNVVRVGYTGISNRIIAVIYNGSNQAVMTYTSPDITANSKIAVKYKANDFALWVDGVKRSSDPLGVTFAAGTLNSLDFNVGGDNHFYSKTKQISVFTEALSDTELESLTSWTSFNEMALAQGYSIK